MKPAMVKKKKDITLSIMIWRSTKKDITNILETLNQLSNPKKTNKLKQEKNKFTRNLYRKSCYLLFKQSWWKWNTRFSLSNSVMLTKSKKYWYSYNQLNYLLYFCYLKKN